MSVLIGTSSLADLAGQLNAAGAPLAERWDLAEACFRPWVGRPDLRDTLRGHLGALTAEQAEAVVGRSRETTTHFAWCLRDEPAEAFTFWLHEYKPQAQWRPGYADSVHNHRYHFCTTIVAGGYLHERYQADLDPDSGLIGRVVLLHSTPCEAGDIAVLWSTDFHRIPVAADTTVTFLVKSRAVTAASLSYDPGTGQSHRHVPVESRLGELAARL